MPGQIFTNSERIRLNSFPQDISRDDLIAFFMLSEKDRAQIPITSAASNRLGFALQLCVLRYLGFCPEQLQTIPEDVVAYLGHQLDIDPQALAGYGQRAQTRTEHFKHVQHYLGFHKASAEELQHSATWLCERALEHDRPSLLFQLACEKFLRDKIVRPGVTIIERMVITARQDAQQEIFRRVSPLLTEEHRILLDQLLLPDSKTRITPLIWLRRGARSNSSDEMLELLNKLDFLRKLGVEDWDLSVINPNRLKFLARIGRKATNQHLQQASEQRRYPILLAFLHTSLLDITDELLDVYDQCLWERDRKSRKDLKDFQQRMFQSLNNRLITCNKLASLVVDQDIKAGSLRKQIYNDVASRDVLCHLIKETEQMTRPEDGGHLDFFAKRYSYIRQFAPKFMKELTFHSASSSPVLKAVDVIRRLDQESQRAVPKDAPRTFIPKKWKSYIFTDDTINRRYYELCTLWELRNALRSGDVWLDNSRRYATLDSYLIPPDKWPDVKPDVCRQISLPEKGEKRLNEREKEVADLFPRVEQVLASNSKIRVEDQRIIVSSLEAEERPESAVLLEQRISKRLPQIDLVDLLIEVDGWIGFSECFTHAGGGGGKRDNRFLHPLYACILAQAENFGLDQMSRISDVSYDRLAWCNRWYLREETIKAAFTKAVNYHHQLPLSQYWGSGMLSSSDGQRFPVAGKFRHAVPLPKYFGYGRGVTFYTWSSDQLSQYGTKFVTSTLRDATYVLDEILDNETDLEILEHTTDTAGYTEVIFALFDLLGLQFSPRIQDLHEQQLWRPASLDMTRFPSFQGRVKGIIHRDVILQHWDQLLRLVGSLKRGWVTASLFIQKLQASPRKHLLMKVLQEYGKLVKTRFILKWYEDEAYRRRIKIQLNKGEALHSLRAYLHIANKGYLRKKDPEALTNQVNCLNLVTNAVIIWNTVYMQAVIDQLKREGEQIDEHDMQHIWPTRYEHINVYGKYHFNIDENLSRKGLRPLR